MIARRTVLLLPLLVAACGGDDNAQQTFPMPSYSYLTPLRLNVASVEIDDRSAPVGGNSVGSLSPLRPGGRAEANGERQAAGGGNSGRAVFVIEQASLTRSNGGIDASWRCISTSMPAAIPPPRMPEARVVRRRTSTDTDEDARTVLYNFTLQMMKDMNGSSSSRYAAP
ncbi:MAG: hypothetical protein WDN49_05980 [Acetobacteraceae bacterium]